MYYSSIGLLAALVLLIINQDILFQRRGSQKNRTWILYRNFLYSVLVYYITDILWGILDSRHMVGLLFLDTTVYFLAMAFGVFFWTRYVIVYLNGRGVFREAPLRRRLRFFGRYDPGGCGESVLPAPVLAG